MPTLVEQDCVTIALPDGSSVYQITSTVTDKGDLPQEQIFVFSIPNPPDPDDDVFERVGSPYDIQNITVGRTAAIAAGQTEYLSLTMVRKYEDLEIAVQAKAAIKSRIDQAVRAWVSYDTEFEGSVVVSHPTTDPEYEQALKDAYADAKATRIAAEGDVTSAEAAITVAEGAAELASERESLYENEKTFCAQSRENYWSNFYTAINIFKGNVEGIVNASVVFKDLTNDFVSDIVDTYNSKSGQTYTIGSSSNTNPSNDWTGIYAALDAFGYGDAPNDYQTDGIDVFNGQFSEFKNSETYKELLDASFLSFCQAAQANYSAAVTQKSLKDIAVAEAVTAKEGAEAALASAQTAEDEALAAVLAVCPDFDSSSV